MSEIAIFLYGLAVFSIVAVACWIIVWGIFQERRDRETTDAGPGARPDQPAAATATARGGETVAVPPAESTR